MKKNYERYCFHAKKHYKTLLRMKLISFFVFFTIVASAANTYSQQSKFNFDLQGISIRDVFREIENNSEYILLYNEKLFDAGRLVDIKVKNETVETILNQIFAGTEHTYKIYDRQIVILTGGSEKSVPGNENPASSKQQQEVKGKVTDSKTGLPLPGVNVVIKETTTGVITDLDGNFTIILPGNSAILVFSYIGYQKMEVEVTAGQFAAISLVEDLTSLDEVIVIGYGVQKKSLVTGSISKIDAKDITAVPVSRLDQALQGKTSGVYVAQSSGTPGGAMSIRIRGQSSDGLNSPVYIVNGIKTLNIEFLTPGDIESIEILKDAASCAIYGAEGGNGVVIISTKKGVKGSSRINYNYYHGWQSVAHTVTPMNAEQYINYNKEAYMYETGAVPAKYDEMAASGINTNWVGELFQLAPVNEHNISFSSGTENSSFLLSASSFNQDGIIGGPKSNFTRYTFLLNGESDLKKWLSIGSTVNYAKTSKANLPESREDARGIINSAIYYDPTAPVYYNDISEAPYSDPLILDALVRNDKGQIYYNSPETELDASNPLALIENTHNTTQTDRVLGDIHGNVKFFEWLKFTSRLSFDYSLIVENVFQPKYYYDAASYLTNDTLVSVTNSYTRLNRVALDNYLSFIRNFGDHSIEVMAGMSYEQFDPTFISATGMHIPYGNEAFAYLSNSRGYATYPNTVAGGVGTPVEYDRGELQNSYFGRFVYNYKEKYMLQGNFRKDGSSLFGPNFRYAVFPSFSLGWNISRENFFKDNISVINNLKLRFSWGQNGNKQILNSFGYVTVMNQIISYPNENGDFQYGAIPSRPANLNLRWETSQQSDIGLEMGLLKNKLIFSVDRYLKSTIDQLSEKANTPMYMGFPNKPYENNGEVSNKGWEFDLSFREGTSEFKYNFSFNASYLKNEVISYGSAFKNGYKMNIGDFATVYEPGFPVWYFKGYHALGIFQTQDEINEHVGPNGKPIQGDAKPGDVKYEDFAGKVKGVIVLEPDGKLDESDKIMLGKPMPDWTFGFSFSCQYKMIDFSTFFQGVTGNQIFFSAIQTSHASYNKPNYYYTERWTGPESSNTFPRATREYTKNFRISNLNVSDGDYLRLKNLTLGFTLPESVSGRVGISRLRVYASGTNLLTFTKYKGTDPEIGQLDVNNNFSFGIDRGFYPQAKMHSLGANVTF